jgi:trigger factor
MATTETTERPNKVKLTDVGPSRKKLSIEIPSETVTEHLGTSIETLTTETELPGFRKGRAPKRLVEKRFGSTLRREARNQLVAQAYSKAVEDNKLRVIGDPISEDLLNVELVEGKPLSFEVEIEVLPEFELPAFSGISIKKPRLEVTEEMVQKEVDRLLLNEGRLEPKTAPGKGDYLTGHAVMVDDSGEKHYDIQDAVVQIPGDESNGRGMILGVMVDDFAKQIGKPEVGGTFTVTTTGPENHENEKLRGKKLTITFQIARADEIISATPDEIAQRYGLEDASKVKEIIRDRIQQRAGIEQQAAMRTQIARWLLDNVTMEMPERVTAAQTARNLERRRLELSYRGVDPQKIEEQLAEIRAASNESAVKELKLFFVLDRASESLDVKVTESELNGRIAQMAAMRGERPEKLRQELIARNQIGNVWTQIREHKTLDAIIAKSKVEEISLDEFNKMMGEQAEAGGGKKPAKKSAKKDDAEPAADDAAESKPKSKTKKKAD